MSDEQKRERTLLERKRALPPAARSPAALGLRVAAVRGRFELQVCAECGAVQYPPREACHHCLSTALAWRSQPDGGELISETTLHHSHEMYFRERLPWRIGMVRLDCGPTVIANVEHAVPSAPCRVRVAAHLDESGQAVLVALPEVGAVAVGTAAESEVRDAQSAVAESQKGDRGD
ncbi:MAG TPA: zinc ribbon domain-containing protein [Steroidobacteraceae bacterium]|nr:zinc ribbon domain-containing protein [Steroidobacteraceae bacterium]